METGREAGADTLPPIEPIARLPADVLDALGAAVARSGYTYDTLAAAERVAPKQLDAVRLPLVAWWLERRPGPDAVLARVFTYEDRVPIGAMAEILGDRILGALVGTGILAARDGAIEARLRLTPFEGLLLMSDPPQAGADAVMGPGPTTVMLARALPAAPGSVLDVGCGAGTLALLAAARGAPRAVGVDLSARAIALARVNARLNASAAQFREGDLLAPVRGERFDLVLSQPPYVPLPPGAAPTLYLHGGARGDELALRFAAAVPDALAPGGRAALLFDTPAGGRPLHQAVLEALGDAPVDLVVLAAPGPSADLQAVSYAAVAHPSLGSGYAAAVRRYRDHLEALGATAFSRALVVLRASDRPRGRFTVELPVGGLAWVGAATIDRYLAALDLAASPDDAVLAARVRPVPEARVHEERAAGASDGPPAISVRFAPGWLAIDRELSAAGAFLLDALAASASVGEGAERFAEAAGEDPAAARAKVLAFVREGLSRGLLAAG